MIEIKLGYHECPKPDGAGGVYITKSYNKEELLKTTKYVLRVCDNRTTGGCREDCPIDDIKAILEKDGDS